MVAFGNLIGFYESVGNAGLVQVVGCQVLTAA